MDFTFLGADPRFLYLRRRLETDGHSITAEGGRIIAPPAMETGLPYWRDEIYIIENAALTAEGALELLMRRSNRAMMGAEALLAGYGRIGRFLAGMLSSLGVHVTVAARSRSDRAAARAVGCRAVELTAIPRKFDIVVNTIPAPVLAGDYGGALCLELASAPGGWADGVAVLKAPGLPGLYAPKAAADVMAEAIYRVIEEEENGKQ